MTHIVAISQRVDVIAGRDEHRDALDQRWNELLARCGLLVLQIPNNVEMATGLIERFQPCGVILTGGNDLSSYGGESPERDATEEMLIDWAVVSRRPLLAVCRGLQMLMHHQGVTLAPVTDHAGIRHQVVTDKGARDVNSYHNWGLHEVPDDFYASARAPDGSIEEVRHETLPIHGMMWHPERESPFLERDISMIRQFFEGEQNT